MGFISVESQLTGEIVYLNVDKIRAFARNERGITDIDTGTDYILPTRETPEEIMKKIKEAEHE